MVAQQAAAVTWVSKTQNPNKRTLSLKWSISLNQLVDELHF